jgi:hypothetical protein
MDPDEWTKWPGAARSAEAFAPALGILLATPPPPGEQRSGQGLGKAPGSAIERKRRLAEETARRSMGHPVNPGERQ